jgi:hypothetical protein
VRPSVVDTTRPADEPLTAEEIDDLRRHFAFIRKHRALLRPKLNAKEDRLINASQAPEHRGTCKHLLAKIDPATVTAALAREPVQSDMKARTEFLAGAAAISGDQGVLLQFLESLSQVASTDETHRAFARAVERIDYAGLSAARMSRLLDIMHSAFSEHELPGGLFGLLQSDEFRTAFDNCAAQLKPDVAALFVPLRAVYDAVPATHGGGRRRGRAARDPALAQGLRLMLSAPAAMLTGYSTATRAQLLQTALEFDADWTVAHPGILALLRSFPKKKSVLQREGLGYAKHLVRHGAYKQAKSLVKEIARGGGQSEELSQLLQWLESGRIGHFAVSETENQSGLRKAFCLRELRRVLVRFGRSSAAQQVAEEARIQANICLPGVADLAGSGSDPGERSWVTISGDHRRLNDALSQGSKKLLRADAMAIAMGGIRILRALGLAGLALPDAAPRRFVVAAHGDWTGLLIADFDGVREVSPEEAAEEASRLCAEWCRGALSFPIFEGLSPRRDLGAALIESLREALGSGATPVELAALLNE